MTLRQTIDALANDDPIKVAFNQSRDVDCAALLSAKTQPGPVPSSEIVSFAAQRMIIGRVQALDSLPVADLTGADMNAKLQLKGLLKSVQVVFALPTIDFRLPAVGVMLDGLVSAGLMTADDKTAMIALGNNRLPLFECTAADVEAARKGNS